MKKVFFRELNTNKRHRKLMKRLAKQLFLHEVRNFAVAANIGVSGAVIEHEQRQRQSWVGVRVRHIVFLPE
jgi:hypothetical protein